MPKKDIMRIVLEHLGECGEAALDAFFPKNYAYTAMWRPVLGLDRKRKVDRHTVSAALWRLQRQGLVERIGIRRRSRWRLTGKGKKFQKRPEHSSFAPPKTDGISRLVIFDIPERERKKRDSIRTELAGCGFRQLQKSVWMGECPLPQDFLALIDELNLARNVHIFSIREHGTIKMQGTL